MEQLLWVGHLLSSFGCTLRQLLRSDIRLLLMNLYFGAFLFVIYICHWGENLNEIMRFMDYLHSVHEDAFV